MTKWCFFLQGNTSIKGEIVSNGSRRIVREEIAEGEASTSSLYFLHPCYYFNLAKKAFLKCLGHDSSSDDPSTQKHTKTKESWLSLLLLLLKFCSHLFMTEDKASHHFQHYHLLSFFGSCILHQLEYRVEENRRIKYYLYIFYLRRKK